MFSVDDWNLSPNQRFFVRLRDSGTDIEVDLFNTKADLDGDINRVAFGTIGYGVNLGLVLTEDTTEPSSGDPIAFFNADINYHLKVTGAFADTEKKLQIGPFTDLPPVEDALLVTEAMIQARAALEINRGTHSAFHRSIPLDEHYPDLKEGDFVTLTITKRGLSAEINRIDDLSIEVSQGEDGEINMFDVIDVTVFEDVVR